MRKVAVAVAFLLAFAVRLIAQVNSGELRLAVSDPAGNRVKATAELACAANGYVKSFTLDSAEKTAIKPLPYGIYQLRIEESGFTPVVRTIEVHSTIPIEYAIQLEVAKVTTEIKVDDGRHLDRPGSHLGGHANRTAGDRTEARLTAWPFGAGPGELTARLAV